MFLSRNKRNNVYSCKPQFYYIKMGLKGVNIINAFSPKTEKKVKKKPDIFHISAQNTDGGYSLEPPRRGGSNEYPLSMFLSRNKRNNVYSCKPQFYYIKMGFKGVNIINACSPKTEKKVKKTWYFSYFCSKHRWWVLVRTASARRF